MTSFPIRRLRLCNRRFELLARQKRKVVGILDDLSYHRPPCLWVSEEFGFCDNQIAVRRGIENIDETRCHLKFHAERNSGNKSRLNLLDRQKLGVAADEFLKSALVEIVVVTFLKADGLQGAHGSLRKAGYGSTDRIVFLT